MTPRRDLATRQDIIALVDGFYDRVRADDLIGPIFDGIARVDWAAHLPKMYDFWEAVLFGAGNFKGNPMAVHRALARQAPLTSDAFDRWLALFRETVDERFAGAVAEDAKDRAQRIAPDSIAA
jgi:hemoglobin